MIKGSRGDSRQIRKRGQTKQTVKSKIKIDMRKSDKIEKCKTINKRKQERT